VPIVEQTPKTNERRRKMEDLRKRVMERKRKGIRLTRHFTEDYPTDRMTIHKSFFLIKVITVQDR
jgi:hypothetical protein